MNLTNQEMRNEISKIWSIIFEEDRKNKNNNSSKKFVECCKYMQLQTHTYTSKDEWGKEFALNIYNINQNVNKATLEQILYIARMSWDSLY